MGNILILLPVLGMPLPSGHFPARQFRHLHCEEHNNEPHLKMKKIDCFKNYRKILVNRLNTVLVQIVYLTEDYMLQGVFYIIWIIKMDIL